MRFWFRNLGMMSHTDFQPPPKLSCFWSSQKKSALAFCMFYSLVHYTCWSSWILNFWIFEFVDFFFCIFESWIFERFRISMELKLYSGAESLGPLDLHDSSSVCHQWLRKLLEVDGFNWLGLMWYYGVLILELLVLFLILY